MPGAGREVAELGAARGIFLSREDIGPGVWEDGLLPALVADGGGSIGDACPG
jgi:hypothetical protein